MTDYTSMLHFARTFLCYNLSKNGVHIYHLDKNECGEVLRRWFMYDFFQGNLLILITVFLRLNPHLKDTSRKKSTIVLTTRSSSLR